VSADVYVPLRGTGAGAVIDTGSGIVGRPSQAAPGPTDGPYLDLYYEGNRYGYANVHTWADRVAIAAGRMQESYPTVARMTVAATSVQKVGVFDEELGVVSLLDRELSTALVAGWLGDPLVLNLRELELSTLPPRRTLGDQRL
jgi:hypothetical protein